MSAPIELHVELRDEDEALQLAQFIKRVRFSSVREFTEAHLSPEQRNQRTHVMLDGLNAVARALREKGFAPR